MNRKLSFVRFLYPTFTSYMMEFCLAGTLASVSFLWWKPFITLVCVAKERTALPLGRMWTNEREVEFVWQKLGANLRVHYSSPPPTLLHHHVHTSMLGWNNAHQKCTIIVFFMKRHFMRTSCLYIGFIITSNSQRSL